MIQNRNTLGGCKFSGLYFALNSRFSVTLCEIKDILTVSASIYRTGKTLVALL